MAAEDVLVLNNGSWIPELLLCLLKQLWVLKPCWGSMLNRLLILLHRDASSGTGDHGQLVNPWARK